MAESTSEQVYEDSPYCTSKTYMAPLGDVRCHKQAGHEGWHGWGIEWTDPVLIGGQARLSPVQKGSSDD